MAKVLIIGASKGIGLETVKRALEAGHDVRAFARGAERIATTAPGLEKRAGNALDPADVTAALKGVDAVVQALGVSPGPGMVLGPVRLFSDATRVLIRAMEEAGVKRLICVTGFGAGDSRSRMGCLQGLAFRLALGRVYDDKTRQEALIRESGLAWLIARPVILTNGPLTGRYRVLVEPKDWRGGTISRADVADFLVKQIEDDAYLGTTPVLTA
jgi:putative NADH-flavin reductase